MEDLGLRVRSQVQVRLQGPHQRRHAPLHAAVDHTQDLLLQQDRHLCPGGDPLRDDRGQDSLGVFQREGADREAQEGASAALGHQAP